jgi:L-ribulose-5-phosphate 3-epimerase UlaE
MGIERNITVTSDWDHHLLTPLIFRKLKIVDVHVHGCFKVSNSKKKQYE